MNDFKFVSEAYSKHNTQKYRLSIQINPDGFSVLITGEENKILQIIHRQTGSVVNSRKLFHTDEDFASLRVLNFLSADIIINHSRCCLFPAQEGPDLQPEFVASTDFPIEEDDSLIYRDLEKFGARMVFVLPENLKGFLSDFHNRPRIQHFTSKFLHFEPKSYTAERAYIYSTPGLLHINLKNDAGLKYHNIFECTSDDELVYHLMNALRSLEFDPSWEIFYAGHLDKKNTARKLMSAYLPGMVTVAHELPFDLAWDSGENYFNFLLPGPSEDYQW